MITMYAISTIWHPSNFSFPAIDVFSHMAFLWNFNFFHFRIPYTHLLKSFFASSLSGSIFRTIGNQIAGFLQESGFGLYFAQFEDSRPPAQVAKPDHGFNHSVRIFFFPDKYEICRPVGVDHVFKLKRQEGGGYGCRRTQSSIRVYLQRCVHRRQ